MGNKNLGVELVNKKQIISELIKNKIMPDKNKLDLIIKELEKGEELEEIIERLVEKTKIETKENKINDNNFNKTDEEQSQTKKEDTQKSQHIQQLQTNNNLKTKVEITKSYNLKSKKRNIQDFVSMFNKRYLKIKSMLQARQEMKSIVPLEQIKNKNISGKVSVIGMVVSKNITKNNNLMIEIEDQKSNINILINSKNKDLFEKAQFIVEDEVIGFIGQVKNGFLFVEEFIFPDIPYKSPKKSNDEIYAAFVGDLHIGAKVFLYDELKKFIKWLNGDLGTEKHKHIAKNLGYLFITGDIVEGVAIYPGQFNDLKHPDIMKQFEEFEDFIKQIPKHIQIIIIAGNHDPVRISEPQPTIPKKYFKEITEFENVHFVSNPAYINIHKLNGFSGFDVLLYHGYSIPYYADRVDKLRELGGQKNIKEIVKFLIQKRHLSPTHTSNLYIPEIKEDPMIIENVPDIIATGHVHRCEVGSYKNTLLLNCSCWLGMTDNQRKLGLVPDPARIITFNLKTRKINILNFMSEEKEQ